MKRETLTSLAYQLPQLKFSKLECKPAKSSTKFNQLHISINYTILKLLVKMMIMFGSF